MVVRDFQYRELRPAVLYRGFVCIIVTANISTARDWSITDPSLLVSMLIIPPPGYTLILLYKATEWTKKYNYQQVVEVTFGQPFVGILSLMQFAFPFFGENKITLI